MYVLGIDAGGTSTRAAVCSTDGALLGYGTAGGANLRSSAGDAASQIAAAARTACGQAAQPLAAVAVGAAGAGAARRDEVVALVGAGLADAGVATAPVVVPDLEIAFRSAAPTPDGVLLLSGTGAVAARFEQWECVARCDGMGWLLGDSGSGLWLGRRVLRAAAADLDGRGPATRLTAAVLAALDLTDGAGDPRQALIRAVDELRPADLGRFARLAFTPGDAVATRLVTEAAQALTATAGALGATSADPVVLAGGLLAAGPLRDAVDAHFPAASYAPTPVVGACALAAETLGATLDRARLTEALRAD